MLGGLFDFSTKSTSQTYSVVTTNTDSFNRSSSNNEVFDNVGNVTVNYGAGGETLDRILPIVALGMIVFALVK